MSETKTVSFYSLQQKQETMALEDSYQSCKMVYDLKKEVLDKLDLILQRVNFQVIAQMERCGISDFKLISMSDLEAEISDLFSRLDECITRREKSRMTDESVTFSSGSLIKQNEQLKTQIQSLNNYIQELESGSKQTVTINSDSSKVSELKKEVEILNVQIEKYEKMWRNVGLNPKQLDSAKLKRIYSNTDRMATELIKLRQSCSAMKKLVKTFGQGLLLLSSQSVQRYAALMSDQKYQQLTLQSQNTLLKQEIRNWEYDVRHYVKEKVQALVGSVV